MTIQELCTQLVALVKVEDMKEDLLLLWVDVDNAHFVVLVEVMAYVEGGHHNQAHEVLVPQMVASDLDIVVVVKNNDSG